MEQIINFIGIENADKAIVVIVLVAIVFAGVFCWEIYCRREN